MVSTTYRDPRQFVEARDKNGKIIPQKEKGWYGILQRNFIDGATFLKMDKKLWQYALGSYDDEKTKGLIRQLQLSGLLLLLVNFITCFFIVAGVIRHWS